jgi:hypothetical protein
MKLKILLLLFLILSSEGKLTRFRTKEFSTWCLKSTDSQNREIFEQVVGNSQIKNIILTTDDNFQTINGQMEELAKQAELLSAEEFKKIKLLKVVSVIWTDFETEQKRHSIPFNTIKKIEFNAEEDKLEIFTIDGVKYVAKLSPLIDNYIIKITFRLICLKYETLWLTYQSLVFSWNNKIDVTNLYQYSFFIENLRVLPSVDLSYFFADKTSKHLSGLQKVVRFLKKRGLYDKINNDVELPSFLSILRFFNKDNVEIFYNAIKYKDEKALSLAIKDPESTKRFVNLPLNFYEILREESNYDPIKTLISEPDYLGFKAIQHLVLLDDESLKQLTYVLKNLILY